MSQSNQDSVRLDWGNGRALSLADRGNGRIELTFDGEAPPKKKVKVDAIDNQGKCRPLVVAPSPDGKTIPASGQTDGAYRIRVYLIEDLGAEIREANLPGVAPMKYVKGPEGGSLIMIGHDGETATAEVIPAGSDWKLVFADNGAKLRAPAPHDVEVQAIAASSAPDQVRQMSVSAGPDANSLLVKGATAGAAYIRIAVKDGNHWHTRCVPLQ